MDIWEIVTQHIFYEHVFIVLSVYDAINEINITLMEPQL